MKLGEEKTTASGAGARNALAHAGGMEAGPEL
jgi:hypothetical protein